MARPEKRRCICSMPLYRKFKPECGESSEKELLSFDEYEVFRLLNLEKKTQNECAERMQISRSTAVSYTHLDVYKRQERYSDIYRFEWTC